MNAYLIQFSATESGGTTMEFLAAFIECQNGFGCYNLIGSYPQGDEKAQAEIFAAIDSFQSSGPAGTISQRFYDERFRSNLSTGRATERLPSTWSMKTCCAWSTRQATCR